MRIKNETLAELKNLGIIVSPFASDEQQEEWIANKKKEWATQWRYRSTRYDYETKEWVGEDEIPDWEEKRDNAIERSLNGNENFWGLWYDTTTCYIRKGDMLFKREVSKSKWLETEYILKVVERDQKAYDTTYGKFAKAVQKMFKENFGSAGFIYPTTYGIGVWVFYNYKAQECCNNVAKVLKDVGITYHNEFSDANWVYRFKIDKKDKNNKAILARYE